MTVSVIVPCYNAEAWIDACIKSILAQGPPVQVIVVDDGSTDRSATIAAGFDGVTVVQTENVGPNPTRNRGIKEATGDFIAFCDADDVWTPGRLQLQLDALEGTGADLVFGRMQNRDATLGPLRDGSAPAAPSDARMSTTMLARREVFERVGPFDEALEVGEMIDWLARAEAAGVRMVQIPDIVLWRRIHGNNLSLRGNRTGYLRALKSTLDTQRANGVTTNRTWTPASYVRQSLELARRTTEGQEYIVDIGMANRVLRLIFAGPAMVDLMTGALSHLRLEGVDREPDATIWVWDQASTGVAMLPPPVGVHAIRSRGDLDGFADPAHHVAYHGVEGAVQCYDVAQREGMYWIPRTDALPYWVAAAPFRTLIHWWVRSFGAHLLHAAAVATEDGALLLSGPGGAGKSSTALACAAAGMDYLGDDFVVVTKTPEPTVWCLYATGKINPDQARLHPDFAVMDTQARKGANKQVLDLAAGHDGPLRRHAPIRAIVMPRFTEGPATRFEEGRVEEVLQAAVGSTVELLPYAGAAATTWIQDLLRRFPPGVIALGSDRQAIPAAVQDFLAQPVFTAPAPDPERLQEKITVVVPVHNGEPFMDDLLANLMAQRHLIHEIIMVDDGSTEPLGELATDLPIRVIRQDQRGPAAARNTGLVATTTNWVAFQDVDDLWPAQSLHALGCALQAHPDAGVVLGRGQVLALDEQTGLYEHVGNHHDTFPFSIGSALFRRDAFDAVGRFDESLRFGEDTDWFVRAQEVGLAVHRLERVTLFVRRHGGNMTAQRDPRELMDPRILKGILDRRKA